MQSFNIFENVTVDYEYEEMNVYCKRPAFY